MEKDRATKAALQKNTNNLLDTCQKSREIEKELAELVAMLQDTPELQETKTSLYPLLEKNEALLRDTFTDCDDIVFRRLLAGKQKALLVFFKELSDKKLLEQSVLSAILRKAKSMIANPAAISLTVISAPEVTLTEDYQEAIEGIVSGKSLLLVDGMPKGLIIDTFKAEKRPISTAENEDIIRGPHDAFNETLTDNLALVRKRCKDKDLKVINFQIGDRTRTTVSLLFIIGLAKPELVAEVTKRLKAIRVDKIIASSNIEERIVDKIWSPFPQVNYTERPDKAVAALYDGRISIVVDNTPATLILPVTYQSIMQSPDDYTTPAAITSLIRITRYIASFVAVFLPAIYISIVSFHPGMLPSRLAISIAELRSRTPFPSFLEALMMEALLEIFQEAITRLPQKIAGAAGVVGALVIGTTVVQAGLVNPLLVVVTAITALASFSMASYNFAMSLRFFRVPVLIASAVFGLYGVVMSFIILATYMCGLKSFGESFLGGTLDLSLISDWKDSFIRVPSKLMKYRPKQFGPQNIRRVPGESNERRS